jgi:hypothetical protein
MNEASTDYQFFVCFRYKNEATKQIKDKKP